jgi:DNA-binding beta-propeller fold protein YncE
VAVDPTTGDVYVAEADNHRVQKFTSTGTFLTKWGTHGSGNGQFRVPVGLAVDPTTGDVYVADNENDRVQKFDSDGTYLGQWGSPGTGNGQFRGPFGVAVNPTTGDVYVADSDNNRVQKFDADGTFVSTWGRIGGANGRFELPVGVAVDPITGDVYVADAGNDRVQKFDSNGTFLTKWGSFGSGNGQFDIPVDLAVDGDGNVYVVDFFGDRVQKFGHRPRPDGRIQRGASGRLVGNNIYNTTGTGQTGTGTAARGQTVTYYVPVQNDGAFAERLRLRGQRSTPNFTVRYYNPAGQNITTTVTAGAFRTPVLTPQDTYRITVVVTVLNFAPRDASVARTLTATSTTYPTVQDTVRFITSRS